MAPVYAPAPSLRYPKAQYYQWSIYNGPTIEEQGSISKASCSLNNLLEVLVTIFFGIYNSLSDLPYVYMYMAGLPSLVGILE